MATYNGASFLEEQLNSIQNQTRGRISVFVSDDGSSDETVPILEKYAKTMPVEDFEIFKGPGLGFAANFMSLLNKVKSGYDYYAFSDQDDVWYPSKMCNALTKLQEISVDVPSIYTSRTELIDVDGNTCGFSPLFKRTPAFKNAIVQNIGGGNTMVFNEATFGVVKLIKSHQELVVSHDWMLYMLVTAVGGEVLYDPVPSIKYRQHGNNLVGENQSFNSKINRIIATFVTGVFKEWNTRNIKILSQIKYAMTQENLETFEKFCLMRKSNTFEALRIFADSGVYRQSLIGSLALYMSILMKKI